ncbi:MAG: dihydropyrimidinase [Clostridia bacterium]|nr:dihydropyrimidinase [Clostridia bacterium]
MDILIKNGTVVNSDVSFKADVAVHRGKIFSVGVDDAESASKVIDASGCLVFPGGIDPHVHMQLPTPAGPSSDNFLTGSRAALMGGTTTLFDFVTPAPGELLPAALALRQTEAQSALTNVFLHVSPTTWRTTMPDEMSECVEKFHTRSFKCYLAYLDTIGLMPDVLEKVMKEAARLGASVLVHCEEGKEVARLREKYAKSDLPVATAHYRSRPPEFEARAVDTAIQLARKTGCTLYIVHVSAAESLELIAKAQAAGQKIYAETCPQYLLLDEQKYHQPFGQAAPYIISPPLRKAEHQQALWEAVANGTIQTIGSDHCPFTLKQKMEGKDDLRKIPNGAGGVEHRLALLYTYGVLTGKISLNRFVELTSTNAARIFGLYPDKGVIAPGADADIVVWNPEKPGIISHRTHHQHCDSNIYEGMQTTGAADYVVLGGKMVVGSGR